MKLSYVRPAGFRGFREVTRIGIPPGFLVVCGANGSGKTSICDAIEFALAGQIQWRQGETERQERIADYYWWRGRRVASERFVELGIRDIPGEIENGMPVSQGEQHEGCGFRRGEGGEVVGPYEEIRSTLVDAGSAPKEAVERLCQTSIIRDEEITELSIELAERDRYRFVMQAVGSTELPAYVERAEEVKGILDSSLKDREEEYQERKEELNRLIQEKSRLESELQEAEAVNQAVAELESALDLSDDGEKRDMEALTERGRKQISGLRDEIEEIRRLADKFLSAYESLPEDRGTIQKEFEEDLEGLENELEEIEERISQVEAETEKLKGNEPKLSSLAELQYHGEAVGLEDGHCPLCGSEIEEDAYERHLDELAERIAEQRLRLDELRDERQSLMEKKEACSSKISEKREEYANWKAEIDEYESIIDKVREDLTSLGWSKEPHLDESSLEEFLESKQTEVSSLLSAVDTVESSKAAEEITEIEEQIEVARSELAKAERRYEQADHATQRLEAGRKAFDRIQGDIIDERLAAISPVLEELYVRLRPHVDWREVSYQLRGDVRRFLSLEVGDELNPRFLFSSGQRRASGLAFLLAVHLSASWSNLNTLVLDDPVQHIDDYRALHLVEVLAALRKNGKQIVCTVEDRDLANLLCRRLNTGSEGGALAQLAYEPGVGVVVDEYRHIEPVEERIFEAAG